MALIFRNDYYWKNQLLKLYYRNTLISVRHFYWNDNSAIPIEETPYIWTRLKRPVDLWVRELLNLHGQQRFKNQSYGVFQPCLELLILDIILKSSRT